MLLEPQDFVLKLKELDIQPRNLLHIYRDVTTDEDFMERAYREGSKVYLELNPKQISFNIYVKPKEVDFEKELDTSHTVFVEAFKFLKQYVSH